MIRGSCSILNSGPLRSLSASSAARSLSALTTMDRNLRISKRRPSRPHPLLPIEHRTVILELDQEGNKTSAGAARSVIRPATTMSKERLIAASKPLNDAEVISRSGW